ncbi:1556_t:CDS:1, partial [Ambispora gerdemannii]
YFLKNCEHPATNQPRRNGQNYSHQHIFDQIIFHASWIINMHPPNAIYNSADKLFESAQRFANSQGYALVKKRTRKDHCGELKNIALHCDRGDVYENSLDLTKETRHRQKSTRLIDCHFELYAVRRNGLWYLEV